MFLASVLPEGVQAALSTVSGMHQFRKFLFSTEGESSCQFWLDVERLKHLGDHSVTSKLLLRIQLLYLTDGAPFSLNDELKEMVLHVYHPSRDSPAIKRVDTLIKMQSIVLRDLQSYWCKKYVLHLQEDQQPTPLAKTMSSIFQDDRNLAKYRDCLSHLPRIITDEGNANADKEARSVSQVTLNTYKLPHINKSGSVLTSSGKTDKLLEKRQKGDPVGLMITASTKDLFPRSIREPPQTTQPGDCRFHPFLSATIRSDSMAGNPFLRYLVQRGTGEVLGYLLFWQSVENILTEDEMRRWYRRHMRKDTCPYFNSFEVYPIATNLKELLHLFVREKASYQIDLPSHVRNELVLLLPKGLGQHLLVSAQEYTAQVKQNHHFISVVEVVGYLSVRI